MANWAILIGLYAIGTALAIAFRRGPTERVRRSFLGTYRNGDLPRILRNGWMWFPILWGLLLPAILIVAILFGQGSPPDWPHWARSALVWGLSSYAALAMGISLVLAYRPPRWLVPQWLQNQDMLDRYVTPPPDWFDRTFLGIGIVFLIGCPVFAVYGVFGMLGTPGL